MDINKEDAVKHLLNYLLDDELITQTINTLFETSQNLGSFSTAGIKLERDVNVKIPEESESTIPTPTYSWNDFKTEFRVSKSTFELLLGKIAKHFKRTDKIPGKKKLLVALWTFTHLDTFEEIADRFNITTATVYNILLECTDIIIKELHSVLKFPDTTEQDRIATEFEAKSDIPGIVGVVGITRIVLKHPPRKPFEYYNKKGLYSIILQGISNDQLMFTDVFVGMPGGMEAADVYYKCPLFSKIQNNISLDYHLIGSNVYTNSNFMMTPYRDDGYLSQSQNNFNTAVLSVHQTLTKTFALLKGRFRRLTCLDVNAIQLANKIIYSCCILHNFILEKDGVDGDVVNEFFEEQDEEDVDIFETITETDKRLLYASYF